MEIENVGNDAAELTLKVMVFEVWAPQVAYSLQQPTSEFVIYPIRDHSVPEKGP